MYLTQPWVCYQVFFFFFLLVTYATITINVLNSDSWEYVTRQYLFDLFQFVYINSQLLTHMSFNKLLLVNLVNWRWVVIKNIIRTYKLDKRRKLTTREFAFTQMMNAFLEIFYMYIYFIGPSFTFSRRDYLPIESLLQILFIQSYFNCVVGLYI